MVDQADWILATWAGNRLSQHREFQALPFREKLRVVESLGEVTEFFALRARARAAAVKEPRPSYRSS